MDKTAGFGSTTDTQRRRRRGGGAVACAVALLAAGGCYRQSTDRTVTISYDQVANFPEYSVNPGVAPVRTPGAIMIMYRITKVKNDALAAVPFTLAKDKIATVSPFATTGPKTSDQEPPEEQQLLGAKLADNLNVKPGKVVTTTSCVIKVLPSDHANVLADKLVPLTYENDATADPVQTVKMVREPTDNVTAVVGQATPVNLGSLCGS